MNHRRHDADVLAFDPWEGDMDSDARTLRDQFAVTRVLATCTICREEIPVGSRVRAQTQQSTEQRTVMTFKFCETCCTAMAIAADNWEAIEARYAIGIASVEARRAVRPGIHTNGHV